MVILEIRVLVGFYLIETLNGGSFLEKNPENLSCDFQFPNTQGAGVSYRNFLKKVYERASHRIVWPKI